MRPWLRAVLGAPLLHFTVLGGALFVSARTFGSIAPPPPGPTDLVSGSGDDELLYREALAVGLDRTDPLVRRRLAQLAEIVAAGDLEDPAALEREARRLGLDRRDLVVRRHLVHAMSLALAHPGPHDWPSDDEVAAYFARHRERYVEPPRVRFRHVFFTRDRRGESAERAAARALATLRAGGRASGDAFLWGSELAMSEPELARRFGPEFAAAMADAPLGRWMGPVRSSYGAHVVWPSERTPPTTPEFETVRSRVVHALLAEQAAARLDRRLAGRRTP